MRRILATLAPLAATGLIAGPAGAQDSEREMTRGEKHMERILEGRVAGEPERCIFTPRGTRISIVDGEGLVFRVGTKVYVNRTANPETLDDDDYLLIRRFGSGSTLCGRESFQTYSRGGSFFTGVVFLEDFVPYERVDENDA